MEIIKDIFAFIGLAAVALIFYVSIFKNKEDYKHWYPIGLKGSNKYKKYVENRTNGICRG